MAGNARNLYRGQIRTLFDVGTTTGLTDGQLLERFATRRDEGSELAFAALVERHGPMVLRACRSILRDDHEAMDAFQATFLVLARKGGSLWVRDSVGPWLHRVACHTAGRARRATARRRTLEKRVAEMAERRGDGGRGQREELASLIHEEVNRLPERYRSAVVLCDLEGRTCEEAARHLGCPVGTVGSRLSRGRERLRDRLRRRDLPAGLVALAGGRVPVPLPPELVDATTVAAVRFVSVLTVPHGPVSSLALEVLRTMAVLRWWKVAAILLALGVSTSGVLALAGRDGQVAKGLHDDPPRAAPADETVTEVTPGKLAVVFEERGSLESSLNADVFSKVEGRTTILSIVPEGTRVTKGQLVAELDSAALKDQLTNQKIATEGTKAAYQNARLAREVAEIGVHEYVDGIYPRDRQAAANEIALARSATARAEARLQRTRTARERLNVILADQGGTKTPADIVAALEVDDRLAAAEQDLDQEQRALEIARANRDVLERFTRDRTIKQLGIEAEKARASELAKQHAWEFEQQKETMLQKQIASCKLVAPSDGFVVYANDPSRFGGSGQPQIEQGATVRERQKIFSLVDVNHLRVNAKVHESIVDQVTPGMEARIMVDAFPDVILSGVVEDVAPLPDSNSFFNSDVKVYTTHIALKKSIPGLRPGMTVLNQILVAELDNVLSVPVAAVVWYDDKDHVAVKTPDGKIDWREVSLGRSSAKQVEVKEGLKPGEKVALEPMRLLSEEQKRAVTDSPPRRGSRFRAARKGGGLPSPSRAKLMAIPPEDRAKFRDATPKERNAILKKAGFTDAEVTEFNKRLQQTNTPR